MANQSATLLLGSAFPLYARLWGVGNTATHFDRLRWGGLPVAGGSRGTSA